MSCSCLFSSLGFAACLPVLIRLAGFVPCPACICGLVAFVPFPRACCRRLVLSLACLYFVAWLVSCRVLPVRVACLLCLVWLVCRPCSASICGFVPFLPFPVCVCLRRSVWPLACLYFVGWLVSRRLCRGRGFVFRLACLSCAAGACQKQENATREKDENSRRMRKKDVFEFAERFGSYSARCEHDEKPDPKRAIFPFFRLTP